MRSELKAVFRSRKRLDDARKAYAKAVQDASAAGISYTSIGAAAGVTEGAVRQTLKRSQEE